VPHAHFTLYAWRVSWYAAKVRSYLQVKGIPFNEQKPSLLTFKHSIPKHCGGDAVVPAVVPPEGDWLQDSSLIIEQLERRYPAARVLPAGPVQGMFSLLDEFARLPAADAEHVRNWLKQNDAGQLLELQFPRARRVGLHIAAEIQH
jgi:glutathione S-transferase